MQAQAVLLQPFRQHPIRCVERLAMRPEVGVAKLLQADPALPDRSNPPLPLLTCLSSAIRRTTCAPARPSRALRAGRSYGARCSDSASNL